MLGLSRILNNKYVNKFANFKNNIKKKEWVDIILDSNFFDLEYYNSQVDIPFKNIQAAVKHYVFNNADNYLNPHPLFNNRYYLSMNIDVHQSGVNPLYHYIQYGNSELREPSVLFKPLFFLSQLPPKIKEKASKSPLSYYLENPYKAKPIALFEPKFYSTQCKNLNKSNPYLHYLKHGYKKGFKPHILFEYSENENKKISPLEEYLASSNPLLVDVHPLFDMSFYCSRYPDVKSSGLDPLTHYILIGSGCEYWPNPLFWPNYYEKQCVKNKLTITGDYLSHYIFNGEKNNVSPCPWFDLKFYKETYKFVTEDHRGVLAHYIKDGSKHNFMPSESFSPKLFKSRYNIPDDVDPLEYYVHNLAGKPTLPEKAWYDSVPEYKQLEIVKEHFKNKNIKPEVSVIVPVYNNYSYTLRCLYSIAISNYKSSIEVIIADDVSSDETYELLSEIDGIVYVRNSKNLGFLLSCNNAVQHAVGEFIFLLNNDTAVLPGWIDSLVTTFRINEKIGLVGSKLLYPNGVLQEAGGILWSEGAANFGKFDDPAKPEYSYLRQVDYVSGAAILLPKSLWNAIGGFDEQYVPAYCEDSDLCLKIRSLGLRVMMQPSSKIVHFEGISSGTDLNSGIKKYQVENSIKLQNKWANILKGNGENGDFAKSCIDRDKGPRILIIDATIPTPDQDAGSVTVWYFLKIFKNLGFNITFIPENLYNSVPYTSDIQALGIECLYRPYCNDIEKYIEHNANLFDVIMLYRVSAGGRFYEAIRKFAPHTKIIFDTVDLHFLREERQAKMEKNAQLSNEMLKKATATKDRELFLIQNSDISIVLSNYEKRLLSSEYEIHNTFVIPIVLENQLIEASIDGRKDIAFIGGYQHTPNVDAVLYFVENLWPEIKKKIKGIKFYVIGSKPTPELLALSEDDKDIIVTGFVETLEPWLNNLRLTIAPLRYGAGIKGKIGSSLSYGVPCIATNVAAEGMGLENGHNILMSGDENEFIENLVSAYTNDELWKKLSNNGLQFVEENYSIQATQNKILSLFNAIKVPPFVSLNPFSGQLEYLNLKEPPLTDKLVCERFNTTISERLLAKNIIHFITTKYNERVDSIYTAIDILNQKEISLTSMMPDDVLINENISRLIGKSTVNNKPSIGLSFLNKIENGEFDKLIKKMRKDNVEVVLGVILGQNIDNKGYLNRIENCLIEANKQSMVFSVPDIHVSSIAKFHIPFCIALTNNNFKC